MLLFSPGTHNIAHRLHLFCFAAGYLVLAEGMSYKNNTYSIEPYDNVIEAINQRLREMHVKVNNIIPYMLIGDNLAGEERSSSADLSPQALNWEVVLAQMLSPEHFELFRQDERISAVLARKLASFPAPSPSRADQHNSRYVSYLLAMEQIIVENLQAALKRYHEFFSYHLRPKTTSAANSPCREGDSPFQRRNIVRVGASRYEIERAAGRSNQLSPLLKPTGKELLNQINKHLKIVDEALRGFHDDLTQRAVDRRGIFNQLYPNLASTPDTDALERAAAIPQDALQELLLMLGDSPPVGLRPVQSPGRGSPRRYSSQQPTGQADSPRSMGSAHLISPRCLPGSPRLSKAAQVQHKPLPISAEPAMPEYLPHHNRPPMPTSPPRLPRPFAVQRSSAAAASQTASVAMVSVATQHPPEAPKPTAKGATVNPADMLLADLQQQLRKVWESNGHLTEQLAAAQEQNNKLLDVVAPQLALQQAPAGVAQKRAFLQQQLDAMRQDTQALSLQLSRRKTVHAAKQDQPAMSHAKNELENAWITHNMLTLQLAATLRENEVLANLRAAQMEAEREVSRQQQSVKDSRTASQLRLIQFAQNWKRIISNIRGFRAILYKNWRPKQFIKCLDPLVKRLCLSYTFENLQVLMQAIDVLETDSTLPPARKTQLEKLAAVVQQTFNFEQQHKTLLSTATAKEDLFPADHAQNCKSIPPSFSRLSTSPVLACSSSSTEQTVNFALLKHLRAGADLSIAPQLNEWLRHAPATSLRATFYSPR